MSEASQLVQQSLQLLRRQDEEARQAYLQRLADHYYGELEGDFYFPRYYAETVERHKDRPRVVLPLCAAGVEVLTSAMVGDGVQASVQDENSNAVWQQLLKANDYQLGYSEMLATVAGTYGWSYNRLAPVQYPLRSLEDVEFEAVDPRYFRTLHNGASVNRSKRRPEGVVLYGVYDTVDGQLARGVRARADQKTHRVRMEVISPTRWEVWLDEEPAPYDPVTGELWQPSKDGSNPFGVIPGALLWSKLMPGQFGGRSDMDPAYKIAEEINRLFSQVVLNLHHYFPVLTMPRGSQGANTTSPLTMGLGFALEYDPNGSAPSFIVSGLDIDVLMEPLRALLNLFFSLSHTPASTHGLGTLFGQGQGEAESGKAKHYEYAPLIAHVRRKRANYERHLQALYDSTAVVLERSPALGKAKLKPGEQVTVQWASEIVPVSTEEVLATMERRIKIGLESLLEAILRDRGWPDDDEGRAKAQAILDQTAAEARAASPSASFQEQLRQQIEAGEAGKR